MGGIYTDDWADQHSKVYMHAVRQRATVSTELTDSPATLCWKVSFTVDAVQKPLSEITITVRSESRISTSTKS